MSQCMCNPNKPCECMKIGLRVGENRSFERVVLCLQRLEELTPDFKASQDFPEMYAGWRIGTKFYNFEKIAGVFVGEFPELKERLKQ